MDEMERRIALKMAGLVEAAANTSGSWEEFAGRLESMLRGWAKTDDFVVEKH